MYKIPAIFTAYDRSVYVKVLKFPLTVSPSKQMEDHTRLKNKSPTSAGIESTISGFDRR